MAWKILVLLFVTFSIVNCQIINPREKRHNIDPGCDSQRIPTSINNTRYYNLTINIILHIDLALKKQIQSQYGDIVYPKLNDVLKNIISEANKLLLPLSETHNIYLKLLSIRNLWISNKTEEDAQEYVGSYCKWHSNVKKNKRIFSVLLTGADLFEVTNGAKLYRAAISSFNSACSTENSCTIVKYWPDLTGHILAYQIAYSLGINNDGAGNECNPHCFIMSPNYSSYSAYMNSWSICSRSALENNLKSGNLNCLL